MPLVGWKIGDELVYLAEGQSSDSGSAIDWGQKAGEQVKNAVLNSHGLYMFVSIGLYSSVEESADVAQSVNGIEYFIWLF